eukprot:scaffold1543_cov162-Pinguiococcus_pyrenoidosus.AAC.2
MDDGVGEAKVSDLDLKERRPKTMEVSELDVKCRREDGTKSADATMFCRGAKGDARLPLSARRL